MEAETEVEEKDRKNGARAKGRSASLLKQLKPG